MVEQTERSVRKKYLSHMEKLEARLREYREDCEHYTALADAEAAAGKPTDCPGDGDASGRPPEACEGSV